MENSLSSQPHPHWSRQGRKNSLKRDTPRRRGKGGVGRGRSPHPRPFHSCSGPSAVSRGTCVHRRGSPYLQRPAPPLTQCVRSGEAAAGAWERAAPAGVGLRLRVSRGTDGPGSRERGRGGRRKWGKGSSGHTGSALARWREGASRIATTRTCRAGKKLPARILPSSDRSHCSAHSLAADARARLCARPDASAPPPHSTDPLWAHAPAPCPRSLNAFRLLGSAHATTTRTHRLPDSQHPRPHLPRLCAHFSWRRTLGEGGVRTKCYPARQVHCDGRPLTLELTWLFLIPGSGTR
jgi:hypothetical protein